MNVFAVLNSNMKESLTEDNFSEKTNRDYPYYRPEISKKCPYFAICPECGSPIQIINLFIETMEENRTGRKGLHAKHYTQSIPGLAKYDYKKFQNCSLKAKVSLGYHQIRKDKRENKRLKDLVDKNRKKIYDYIIEITKIYFKYAVVNQWIDDYLNKKYYEYKGADDRNLPYSILVTHQAINIFGQKISDTDLGKEIRYSIGNKSKFFRLETEENGRIVEKSKVFPLPQIRMLFYKHKVEDEEETIKIKIYESANGKEYTLFVKEVDVIDCPL